MADVPAWLLVLQTAVSGGIGLAGSFIVPRSQTAAREAAALEAARALMREKAEQVFSEISKARALNNASLLRATDLLRGAIVDNGAYDIAPFRSLDNLLGLLATYFPEAMSIIAESDAALPAKTDPINARLMKAEAGSAENLHFRIEMVKAATSHFAEVLRRLHAFMIEAAKAYAPVTKSV